MYAENQTATSPSPLAILPPNEPAEGAVCQSPALARLPFVSDPTTLPHITMTRAPSFRLAWLLLLPLVASSPAAAQLAELRTPKEMATYLADVAARKRARIPPAPPACLPTTSARPDFLVRPGSTRISGRVTGVSGGTTDDPPRGLEGAAVAVKGTTFTTTTAADGTFELFLPAAVTTAAQPVTLTIRRIGYRMEQTTVELPGGIGARVEAQLCPDVYHLSATTLSGRMASVSVASGDQAITNVQESGVDEGGIVKRADNFLVILRRGRLFTIDVRARSLRPVATVDAYAPWINPERAWLDELIVYGNRVVVVGFDYKADATTIGVFHLDARGGLRHEHTFTLSGSDYYSSRNYASRLVGSRLVFYTPVDIPLGPGSESAGTEMSGNLVFLAQPAAALPTLREWRAHDSTSAAGAVTHTQRVYRPVGASALLPIDAMHSLTTCDLARDEFACESVTIFGPDGSAHYVSPTALYLSTSTLSARITNDDSTSAQLIRVPLDGRAPSSVLINGSAIDQFSFSERDGTLHVLLRASGQGARMWDAEQRGGALTLLSVSVEQLSQNIQPSPSQYRTLPALHSSMRVQNRFVGDALLYGGFASRAAADKADGTLFVASLRDSMVDSLTLGHDVERIEVLGTDALVVGQDSADNLHFSGVQLSGSPSRRQHHVVRDGEQMEARSHAFFYRPDIGKANTGILALPISREDSTGKAFENQIDAVTFLRNTGRGFTPLGELASQPISPYDGCKASCADWYGQARPIFFENRFFALIGYELVEGVIRKGKLTEARRLNFAPSTPP